MRSLDTEAGDSSNFTRFRPAILVNFEHLSWQIGRTVDFVLLFSFLDQEESSSCLRGFRVTEQVTDQQRTIRTLREAGSVAAS